MSDRPEVAILMANYNGAHYIAAAIQSVIRQSLTSWELIIVDDASTDDSVALARRAAGSDPRIKITTQAANRGPAAARNRALAIATARWIAIMDSDDLMLPQRLELLLRRAHISGASIIADNLLEFSEDAKARSFLPERMRREVSWISLDAFIRSNSLYSRTPPLGYLKPLIRAEIVRELALRYDETLRIGEDYDFLVRLMARGYRLLLEPGNYYLYRKHKNSVSYRLRASDIEALLTADDRIAQGGMTLPARVRTALRHRRRSLRSLMVYDEVITAIKSGELLGALIRTAAHPHIWPLLTQPIAVRLRRLTRRSKSERRASGQPDAEATLIEMSSAAPS
jgi:succinoglycan biosynthesis protein ExoO